MFSVSYYIGGITMIGLGVILADYLSNDRKSYTDEKDSK